MRRKDRRSAEAVAYRRLYSRQAWKERRIVQLTAHPLCRRCLSGGLTVPATIADHVIPHRGDLDLFWFGDLQSLCGPCHSSAKQREESGGWDSACDLDGYPIDPNHPANRRA